VLWKTLGHDGAQVPAVTRGTRVAPCSAGGATDGVVAVIEDAEGEASPMRIFRPEVQSVLRMLSLATLVALIALPLAWGYEQRRQARTWRTIACAYRMREVVQQAPLIAGAHHAGSPCVTLRRLGLDIDPVR
jgi:hypothetical protein